MVLGIPGTVHDVRFANNGARVTNRDDLVHVLEAALAVDTVDAWTTRLATAGVPAGRVGSIADAFELADVLGLEPTVQDPWKLFSALATFDAVSAEWHLSRERRKIARAAARRRRGALRRSERRRSFLCERRRIPRAIVRAAQI